MPVQLNGNAQAASNIHQNVNVILPPKRESQPTGRLGSMRCHEDHKSADVISKNIGQTLADQFTKLGKTGVQDVMKEIAGKRLASNPELVDAVTKNLQMLQNHNFPPKENNALALAATFGNLKESTVTGAIQRQKTQHDAGDTSALVQDKPQQFASAPVVPPVQEMTPQAVPTIQEEILEPTQITPQEIQNHTEVIDSNDNGATPPPVSPRQEEDYYLTPVRSHKENTESVYSDIVDSPVITTSVTETQTDSIDSISTKDKSHKHRGSDQKALLVGSLISLLTGIVSLSVGLVEKGESSSNTDIPEDQIDQADADLSAQIDTLQSNASLEEQLSETLDKAATACNNDAAEMQQLAQGLADNLDQMVDEGSTLIYNAALEQAESLAYNDPENQAMTTDEYGNLVPTGELTDAAKASCEAQAEAVKEQAVDEMTTAINTVIDNINEKADALSQLSVKTASASDELSTLSQSSLSTADTLKSVQQTFEEMKNAQIDQLNTGLSQAGFDGTMVAGSVSLTLAAGLIAKYGLNRHHNGLNKPTSAAQPAADKLQTSSEMDDAASVATGADAIDAQRVAEIQARPLPEIPLSESVDNSEL